MNTASLSSLLLGSLFLSSSVQSEPLLTSWFTENSGQYATIYRDLTDQGAQDTQTVWSRGAGVQLQPTYAGVHEITHTNDWAYIRTTNLASHIMGPWFQNAAQTNLFVNYPANQAAIYRFPRNPVDPTTISPKTLTGGGTIGYFVNGVSMFDSRDAFSYSTATGGNEPGATGDRAWNSDAYVNESVTFDPGNAHQAGSNYHYHANPPGLRHQLGDSVDYDPATNTYTENFNGKHSPILGWARDGIPIYGPYGYSTPMDSTSAITRMRSGYQIRTDIAALGSARSSWPAWATRVYAATTSFAAGPPVSATFPLGEYLEDQDYKGDLGMTLGVDFDLNEFNVRFGVTPEFPSGTWAYFVNIDAVGTPTFPYNIARAYFGNPIGSASSSIPETDDTTSPLTTLFEGGPEAETCITDVDLDSTTNDLTLVWSATEGGTYEVQESSDLGQTDLWAALGSQTLATDNEVNLTQNLGSTTNQKQFYRVGRKELAEFDDAGFDYPWTAPALPGGPAQINVTMTGGPADLNEVPLSLTFNGAPVPLNTANIIRDSRPELSFSVSVYGLPPGDYPVTAQYAAGALRTGTYTIHASILLMIVDDWGIDASELYNTTSGALLANMPNLLALSNAGVRFTRAYSQPLCSPMRATMLTGRQPFQHNVGTPNDSGQFSTTTDEITLPEIFASQAAPHSLFSVGKWHLGGNDAGYSTRGGWPEFYGITSGGVSDYYAWAKNSNGVSAISTTYSTTDQVNESVNIIAEKVSTGNPWFGWVAFNAPHDPFQDPPANLAPAGGYSAQGAGESLNSFNYRKSLEALDTEIGRLLQYIDPAQTNVILIGDNGTPGQTVQAPFGNGHAKGSIYNGGTQVPFIVKGPSVTLPAGSSDGTLVHCIDMFSTILEMGGISEAGVTGLAAQSISSQSIVPVLNGTDTAMRCVIAEIKGTNTNPARAIIVDPYPDYKLVIKGDPDDLADVPSFEFYDLAADQNEQSPLNISALTGTPLAAYNACLAKDAAMGGGYSDSPGNYDTVYIELPSSGVTPPVPNLLRPNNAAIDVTAVTINGNPATVVGRFDSGTVLTDENDDTAQRYWVKVVISPSLGSYAATSAHVVFPNSNTGAVREYDSISILVNAHP